MLESKDMTNVPVIVVANKIDLVATKNYLVPLQQPKGSQQHFYIQHSQQQSETGNHLVSGGLTNALSSTLLSVNGTLANGAANIQGMRPQPKSRWISSNWKILTFQKTIIGKIFILNVIILKWIFDKSSKLFSDAPIRDRKEISHLVRKNWRSSYIECSAKYNWNVMAVFRELAVTLNMIANGQSLGSKNSKKRRCLMF